LKEADFGTAVLNAKRIGPEFLFKDKRPVFATEPFIASIVDRCDKRMNEDAASNSDL
jgi:hypothetical protein